MRTIDGKKLYEDEGKVIEPDPDETPTKTRKLLTQPYDLVIETLLDQINNNTLYLRPISMKPKFQRRYVWNDVLASKLIESLFLNVPIPQCYLAQNENFELDVIDGQQRIFSIFRFVNNQFKLTGLEVLKELNEKRYFELPNKLQRQIKTYVLRCVVITNDSDPDIRFDIFERLNTNTVPLNTQELRNCIYRGALIDLVNRLAENDKWLKILGLKEPDKRMRGEELILRFFAFRIIGVDDYKTPQKYWLNSIAEKGRKYSIEEINKLENIWIETIDKCLQVFEIQECFRRLPLNGRRAVVNRALIDLTMNSFAKISMDQTIRIAEEFKRRYIQILQDEEFSDLITRAIDHRTRTLRRFEKWEELVEHGLI